MNGPVVVSDRAGLDVAGVQEEVEEESIFEDRWHLHEAGRLVLRSVQNLGQSKVDSESYALNRDSSADLHIELQHQAGLVSHKLDGLRINEGMILYLHQRSLVSLLLLKELGRPLLLLLSGLEILVFSKGDNGLVGEIVSWSLAALPCLLLHGLHPLQGFLVLLRIVIAHY